MNPFFSNLQRRCSRTFYFWRYNDTFKGMELENKFRTLTLLLVMRIIYFFRIDSWKIVPFEFGFERRRIQKLFDESKLQLAVAIDFCYELKHF